MVFVSSYFYFSKFCFKPFINKYFKFCKYIKKKKKQKRTQMNFKLLDLLTNDLQSLRRKKRKLYSYSLSQTEKKTTSFNFVKQKKSIIFQS